MQKEDSTDSTMFGEQSWKLLISKMYDGKEVGYTWIGKRWVFLTMQGATMCRGAINHSTTVPNSPQHILPTTRSGQPAPNDQFNRL